LYLLALDVSLGVVFDPLLEGLPWVFLRQIRIVMHRILLTRKDDCDSTVLEGWAPTFTAFTASM